MIIIIIIIAIGLVAEESTVVVFVIIIIIVVGLAHCYDKTTITTTTVVITYLDARIGRRRDPVDSRSADDHVVSEMDHCRLIKNRGQKREDRE